MSRIVHFGAMFGIACVCLATAVSVLGAWSVTADAISHFRMHLAALSLLLAAIAAVVAGPWPNRWAVVAAVLTAGVNIGLAQNFERVMPTASAGGRALKVMSVNVLYRVSNDDQIVAEIAAVQPDVVLFQELTRARQGLLQRLQTRFPWQVHCGGGDADQGKWNCDVAIVARHPWVSAKAAPAGAAGTKVATAHFGTEWGNLLVIGVHLQWPFVSNQASQLTAVRDLVLQHAGPVVVAGDLNASPWSAAVRDFARQSRLKSAGGFIPTWPRRTFVTGEGCAICVPQLQIDHVFVNEHIQVHTIVAGADVGSDHLPLVADLELPRRIADVDRRNRR